jgi:hypothetical protein
MSVTGHRGRGYLRLLAQTDPARLAAITSAGGRARQASLTPEQRTELTRHAIEARWSRTAKLRGMVSELDDIERERREAERLARGLL